MFCNINWTERSVTLKIPKTWNYQSYSQLHPLILLTAFMLCNAFNLYFKEIMQLAFPNLVLLLLYFISMKMQHGSDLITDTDKENNHRLNSNLNVYPPFYHDSILNVANLKLMASKRSNFSVDFPTFSDNIAESSINSKAVNCTFSSSASPIVTSTPVLTMSTSSICHSQSSFPSPCVTTAIFSTPCSSPGIASSCGNKIISPLTDINNSRNSGNTNVSYPFDISIKNEKIGIPSVSNTIPDSPVAFKNNQISETHFVQKPNLMNITTKSIENNATKSNTEIRPTSSKHINSANYEEKEPSCHSFTELKALLSSLPKFNGQFSKYKQFKSRFNLLIDNFDLNENEKAFLLYCCLDEGVVELLGIISQENLCYKSIWEILDQEYCLPQNGILYHTNVLTSLNEWPVCKTLESLNKLYIFLLQNYRALEIEKSTESETMFGMKILSILDGELAYNVASLIDSSSTDILSGILGLIKQEIKLLEINKISDAEKHGLKVVFENESLTSEDFKNFSQNHNLSFDKTHSIHKGSSEEGLCDFCKTSTHTSVNCNRFNHPSDFHISLFHSFRCFNCLEKGHKSYSCPKEKLCSFCNDDRPHHSVVCTKNPKYL